MRWFILAISILFIILLLLYFRRNIIRKAKLMQSPFKYFTFDEFDSSDEPGSGKRYMSHELIRKLDIARECAGFPFVIESAYRSYAHNKKVGGVKGSAHTKGLAVDIDYKSEEDLKVLLKCLVKVGFTRFGIRWKGSGTSVHVDMDSSKPKYVTWGYNDKDDNLVVPPNPWSYA